MGTWPPTAGNKSPQSLHPAEPGPHRAGQPPGPPLPGLLGRMKPRHTHTPSTSSQPGPGGPASGVRASPPPCGGAASSPRLPRPQGCPGPLSISLTGAPASSLCLSGHPVVSGGEAPGVSVPSWVAWCPSRQGAPHGAVSGDTHRAGPGAGGLGRTRRRRDRRQGSLLGLRVLLDRGSGGDGRAPLPVFQTHVYTHSHAWTQAHALQAAGTQLTWCWRKRRVRTG